MKQQLQRGRFGLLTCLLVVFATAPAFSQSITTGDVSGVVRDATDAVIPSASVTLRNLDDGSTQTVTTNATGAFRFTLVRPGNNYVISAETSGLRTDNSRIQVLVGQVLQVNLLAKVSATQQTIDVTAQGSQVQTETADLSATFTARQLANLPAGGGDLTTVAFSLPGIVVNSVAGSGGYGWGNFSSHGLPATANLFTTNGQDNNDPYLSLNNTGASNLSLGLNEVDEVAVVQNAYSVQYGRNAGAQVNFTTKSGTNAYHGSLLYNYNSSGLNANDFFANASGTPRGKAVSNQYAASFGGRAIRDKLFFFVDTEGIRYTVPTTGGTVAIPSQPFETYILSNVPAAQQAFYQQAFGVYNTATGVSRAVPVTTGSGPLQDATGTLGCGSQIAGMNLAAPGGGIFGQSAPCALAYGSSGSGANTEWLLTTRADWNIDSKNRVNFRYKTDHGRQPSTTSNLNPVFDVVSIQPEHEGQANWTYTISPNMVNNLIASAAWYSADFAPVNSQATLSAFPTTLYIPVGGTNTSNGLTELGIPDNFYAFPSGRNVGQGQVIDDVSFVKGNHTLKVGGNFRKNRVTDESNLTNSYGYYEFNSLLDFANGSIGSGNGSFYTQGLTPFPVVHLRLYNLGLYAQDEWTITPHVKLTFGLRVDRTGNPTCTDDCFTRLDTAFTDPSYVGDAATPYNQTLKTNLSHTFQNVDFATLQPRVGIVASPFGSRGPVIRAGFGIFADTPAGVVSSLVFGNPPNVFAPFITSGAVDYSSNPNSAPGIANASYRALESGFSNGATLAQLEAATGGLFSPPTLFQPPDTMHTPKFYEGSFEIQQPIGQKNVLVLTYSGNFGSDLLASNPLVNAYDQRGLNFGGLPNAPKDPRFANVIQIANNGISNYNGVSAQFRRAFAYGFQGQISYTYSHALDDLSNNGNVFAPFNLTNSFRYQINPNNLSSNYGNSDYDIRNNLAGDFTWEIPHRFSNRLVNAALGGWMLGGKLFVRSGLPFSVVDTATPTEISPNLAFDVLLGTATGPVQTNCGRNAINTPCFTESQFVPPGEETGFGNLARNAFRGPGFFDIDTTLNKRFALSERVGFTVGVTAFNLLNHPNFAPPNADLANSATFGVISSTAITPTSAYGSFAGSGVSGRLLVLDGKFTF